MTACEGQLGWFQQHILAHITAQKVKVQISDGEQTMLNKLRNEMTGIIVCDSKFLNLMKTILNFAIAFEEK